MLHLVIPITQRMIPDNQHFIDLEQFMSKLTNTWSRMEVFLTEICSTEYCLDMSGVVSDIHTLLLVTNQWESRK